MFQFRKLADEINDGIRVEEDSRQLDRLERELTDDDVRRVLQAVEIVPHASGGLIEAYMLNPQMTPDDLITLSAYDDGSPEDFSGDISEILEEDDDRSLFTRGLWEYGIKPVIRGAFTLSESAFREATRPLLATGTAALAQAEDVTGFELTNASTNPFKNYQSLGNSSGVEFLQGLGDGRGGNPADIGKGFFPTGANYLEQEAQNTLDIRGEQANLGHLYAASLLTPFGFDPGNRVYDIGAGVTQFASEAAIDPLAFGLGGSQTLAKVSRPILRAVPGVSDDVALRVSQNIGEGIGGARRRARRLDVGLADRLLVRLRESGGEMTDEIAQEMFGLINQGDKGSSVLAERLLPWARQADVVERIAGSDYADLMAGWQRSGAHRVPDEIIRRLGGTTDKSETARILTEAIAKDHITEGGFYSSFGSWRRSHINNFKLSGTAAVGVVGPQDIGGSATKIDTLMKTARVPFRNPEGVKGYSRADMLNDLLSLEPNDYHGFSDVMNKAYGAVAEQLTGVSPKSARLFIKDIQNLNDDMIHGLAKENMGFIGNPQSNVFDGVRTIMGPDGPVDLRMPNPMFVSEVEQAARFVLPDIQAIRRGAHKNDLVRKVYQSQGWDYNTRIASAITSKVFKPYVLLRLSYIARTQGDDQLRMATQGYDSLVRNPFRFITAYLKDPKAAKTLIDDNVDLMSTWEARLILGRDITGAAPSGGVKRTGSNVWGSFIKDEHVIRNGVRKVDSTGAPIAGRKDIVPMGDSGDIATNIANPRKRTFMAMSEEGSHLVLDDGTEISKEIVDAWLVDMQTIANDPMNQYLLRNPYDVDGLLNWLDSDEVFMGVSGRDAKRVYRNVFGAEEIDNILTDTDLFETRVLEVMEHIEVKTGGSQDLLDMMMGASEKINIGDEFTDPRAMREALAELHEYMPQVVQVEAPRLRDRSSMKNMYRRMVDAGFENIVSRPANYFSRFPAWRQAIAENLETLMRSAANDALRDEIFEAARDNLKVSKRWLKKLDTAREASRGKEGIIDNLADVQEIAFGRAVHRIEDLLFDVSTRSAFQEQFDAIFPFVDAWRESLEVWGRIVKDNPAVVARGLAFSRATLNSGFVYTNDRGEKMFALPHPPAPLAGLFSGASIGANVGIFGGPVGALIGGAIGGAAGLAGGMAVADSVNQPEGPEGVEVRQTLNARVEGVNLALSSLNSLGPGVGPYVGWPIGAFTGQSNDEETQGLRDLILPYGSEFSSWEDLTDFSNLGRAIAPAWAEKVVDGLTSGRWNESQFESMRGEALNGLAMTGNYDTSDPADALRLVEDSHRATQYLLLVRGAVQGVFLTGPQEEWELNLDNVDELQGETLEAWNPREDPTGQWHTLQSMQSAYYELVNRLKDPDAAFTKFVEIYGVEPWYLARGKTFTRGPQPASLGGRSWMQNNPETVYAYPEVAGYLAPSDDGDDFSYQIWLDQIEEEETREFYKPTTKIRLVESDKARQILYTARNRLPDDLPQEELSRRLSIIKGQIEDQHPGWESPITEVSTLTNEQKIDQLAAMTLDENTPTDSPVYPTLRRYIVAREQVLEGLRQASGSPNPDLASRKDSARPRQALYSLGRRLERENPEFSGVWRILRQEVME